MSRHALRIVGMCLVLILTAFGMARADVVFLAPASHANFNVRLFWFRHIEGRFTQVYGNLAWSPEQQVGVVRAWIAVPSAKLEDPRFRADLLGPDFLDAQRYPRIAFVSDPVGPHLLRAGGTVRGQLTLHGVTRRVNFRLQAPHCVNPVTTPCILRLRGNVQRKAFGMRAHGVIVSDKVGLTLFIVLQPLDR